MRLLTALKNDLRFQFRHGFYYAYLVISILYIIFLRSLPASLREFFAGLIIFSDPAMLGFFFIGGLVLLERGQNILESLFVTPIRIYEYFLAKILSLTALALLTSYAILFFAVGSIYNPGLLFLGVTLTSIFFTLIGFTLAVRIKTVNQYLIISPGYVIILVLPILEYFNVFSTPLFYLLPTKASLLLIGGVFTGISRIELIYSIINLGIWSVISYIWAHNWFYKYIILKIGDEQ